jgi:hypothetical protein
MSQAPRVAALVGLGEPCSLRVCLRCQIAVSSSTARTREVRRNLDRHARVAVAVPQPFSDDTRAGTLSPFVPPSADVR